MLADVSAANHHSEWKLKYQFIPVNIAELIESLVDAFAGEAKTKHILLKFQQIHNLPPVRADKDKIHLVIENLIENGIKYNHASGSVTITAEVFNHMMIVSVIDTGIGIPLEDQSHIFNKFYRAGNTQSEKGSGLGLFVAKQIIEDHHGTIWFESTPNIGTTFFFSLPLA